MPKKTAPPKARPAPANRARATVLVRLGSYAQIIAMSAAIVALASVPAHAFLIGDLLALIPLVADIKANTITQIARLEDIKAIESDHLDWRKFKLGRNINTHFIALSTRLVKHFDERQVGRYAEYRELAEIYGLINRGQHTARAEEVIEKVFGQVGDGPNFARNKLIQTTAAMAAATIGDQETQIATWEREMREMERELVGTPPQSDRAGEIRAQLEYRRQRVEDAHNKIETARAKMDVVRTETLSALLENQDKANKALADQVAQEAKHMPPPRLGYDESLFGPPDAILEPTTEDEDEGNN